MSENKRPSPCATCTSANHCCSQISPVGPIPPPFVFKRESERLRLQFGDCIDDFSESGESVRLQTLKVGALGCIFSERGRCTIYASRPLDCRLFPFDVREDATGRLVWIMYTEPCAQPVDVDAELERACTLLERFSPTERELRSFARYGRAFLSGLNSLELGPVEIPAPVR